jgi:hypothetical protein
MATNTIRLARIVANLASLNHNPPTMPCCAWINGMFTL